MLNRRQFVVKEHVGFLKLADRFDVFDAASGEQIGIAREEISTLTKLLRLIVHKMLLPTQINVYEGTEMSLGQPVFSIRRGIVLLRPKVQIVLPDGKIVGFLQKKLISLGGAFRVFDSHERQIAEIKGDWKGWNFKIVGSDGSEIGVVSKKWGGLAKEFFTSADTYVISLSDHVKLKPGYVTLLLAAGLAIDSIFKESQD